MPRNQRHYSDNERAAALAALAANRGNASKTAREVGVPRGTLIHWRDQDRHPEAVENGALKKEELADAYERVQHELLGGVTPEKIAQTADVAKLLTAAGIAADKMRLLRNESTSNLDVSLRPPFPNAKIDLRIAELLAAGSAN